MLTEDSIHSFSKLLGTNHNPGILPGTGYIMEKESRHGDFFGKFCYNLAWTILHCCLVNIRIAFGPVGVASSQYLYANNSHMCHKYVAKITL